MKDVGGGTGQEALALALVFVLLLMDVWLERRLKLGVEESEECCLQVDLAQEPNPEGGFGAPGGRGCVDEVEGTWDMRREMAGEVGSGRVEDRVSGRFLVPLIVERE